MTRGRTFGRNPVFASFMLLTALAGPAGVKAQGVIPPVAQAFEGGEILTRGPVHEAFAEPVVFNPAAGVVVPKAPPGPVEELPPDQKPEGDDVEWVPGYWQWDDDRGDYLWVSGIWRVMPPGRSWVPGYWQQVGGGYQWVSGYWAPSGQQAVDYLPPPPASLEVGPNIPPPAAEGFVWTPGHWFWAEGRYVWRPGMWVQAYPDWIWVPATYAYTPGGCVFIPGYWDHAVARRGMLFAPVYFNQPVYTQPAYVYTPSVSISLALLTSNFFARPSCGHYYFGDYYANNYRAAGYEPWFQMNRGRQAYDPIYAWSAATYSRRDPAWSTQVRETYRYRVDNLDARPARTFYEQERMLSRRQDPGVRDLAIARTLTQESRAEGSPLRLQRIDQARRVEYARREQGFREVRDLRARHESSEQARLTSGPNAPGLSAARRLELPRAATAGHAPNSRAAINAFRLGQTQGHGTHEAAAGASHLPEDFSRANRMQEIQRETEALRAKQAGLQTRQAEALQARQAQQHRHEAEALQAKQSQEHLRQTEALQARQGQERRAQSEAARAAQVQEHRQQAEALRASQSQAQRQQTEALRQRHEQEALQHQDALRAAAEQQRASQAERSRQAQQTQAAETAHRLQAAQQQQQSRQQQNVLRHEHAAAGVSPFVGNPGHLAQPGSPFLPQAPGSPFAPPAHGHPPQALPAPPLHQHMPQAPPPPPPHNHPAAQPERKPGAPHEHPK